MRKSGIGALFVVACVLVQILVPYGVLATPQGMSKADVQRVAGFVTGQAVPAPEDVSRYDANGNGILDLSDLMVVARAWQAAEYPPIPNPPTKRTEWYFMRNKNGQPPQGAWSAQDLRPYGAFYLGDTSRKVIYLAFDTGYENGNTGRILDVLRDNNVHAAFFVTKGFLQYAPDLAVRMAQEGHVVGNHTLNHPDLTKVSDDRFVSEITGCADLYRSITGKEMDPFLRPPEGVFSGRTLLRARDMGYRTIFWSLAYKDWDPKAQPSVSKAYNHIMTYTHPGCITLLHSVSSANAAALDSAIKDLRAQGYEFASLHDLP